MRKMKLTKQFQDEGSTKFSIRDNTNIKKKIKLYKTKTENKPKTNTNKSRRE